MLEFSLLQQQKNIFAYSAWIDVNHVPWEGQEGLNKSSVWITLLLKFVHCNVPCDCQMMNLYNV
jgi:hypothetical protein